MIISRDDASEWEYQMGRYQALDHHLRNEVAAMYGEKWVKASKSVVSRSSEDAAILGECIDHVAGPVQYNTTMNSADLEKDYRDVMKAMELLGGED